MTRDLRKKAQDLLRKAKVYSVPVDLHAVARALKIRVVDEEFEDNISGFLVIKNGKPAIGINKAHHPNRQRFTLAHEIGHFVLHHTREGEDPKNNIHIDKKWAYFRAAGLPGGEYAQEREANQFAAEMLMPKDLVEAEIVKSRLDLSDDIDVAKLASILQVSEQALTYRLLNLGLIEQER